jgi:hypothetical protein
MAFQLAAICVMRVSRAASAREEIAPPDEFVLAQACAPAWPCWNRLSGDQILVAMMHAICSMAFSQFAPHRNSGNGCERIRRKIFLL